MASSLQCNNHRPLSCDASFLAYQGETQPPGIWLEAAGPPSKNKQASHDHPHLALLQQDTPLGHPANCTPQPNPTHAQV
jgi:hypothetical protein